MRQTCKHLFSLADIECNVHHSLHDSDVLIVQTAIASARNKSIVVIEEDTRLLNPYLALC